MTNSLSSSAAIEDKPNFFFTCLKKVCDTLTWRGYRVSQNSGKSQDSRIAKLEFYLTNSKKNINQLKNYPCLTHLDFSAFQFYRGIEMWVTPLAELTQLKVLQISYAKIPGDLAHLKNLETLELTSCLIDATFNFYGMHHLTKLSLRFCEPIEKNQNLPSIRGLSSLKKFMYFKGHFKDDRLPSEILTLNLKKLTINPDYFSDDDRNYLSSSLPNLEELRLLSHSDLRNKLTYSELPFSNLKKLEIDATAIGRITGFPKVTEITVRDCANLHDLRLWDLPSLEWISINKCPALTTIDHSQFPDLDLVEINQCPNFNHNPLEKVPYKLIRDVIMVKPCERKLEI